MNSKIAIKNAELNLMNHELVEIHATIKGNVQGVGFRAMARQLAIRLGIVGTVRNLADGGVELFAFGKKSTVQEFIKELTAPHGQGKVSAVFSEEINPHRQYMDFKILF
jgi:acylphosphatase